MRFLISGYYGYDNAGDEAVLAALLNHVSTGVPRAEFVVTSGALSQTETLHAASEYSLRTIARDDFKTIWREMKNCDAFLSGGGSLLQDATSLRNIVYYTALIRLAHAAKKPAMIYAQGIGPLNKTISQKLTRAALQSASTRIVTLRDPDSKTLLNSIGVTRPIEITADPVWDLLDEKRTASVSDRLRWCVSLRSWPDASTPDAEAKVLKAIRDAAKHSGATLKFLAMQPARDRALIESLGVAPEEILDTENLHPREIMRLAAQSTLMIAMRLHALIFAAAQGVPCVAVSYDPKVKSLAKLIGAPVIENASESELAKLQAAATEAQPPSTLVIEDMKAKARRNAELAAALI